jgi:hypothetical protein
MFFQTIPSLTRLRGLEMVVAETQTQTLRLVVKRIAQSAQELEKRRATYVMALARIVLVRGDGFPAVLTAQAAAAKGKRQGRPVKIA